VSTGETGMEMNLNMHCMDTVNPKIELPYVCTPTSIFTYTIFFLLDIQSTCDLCYVNQYLNHHHHHHDLIFLIFFFQNICHFFDQFCFSSVKFLD
jgi:hypothetical protein